MMTVLKNEYHNDKIIKKDIYNELSKLKIEFLDGRQPIVAILDIIRDNDYYNSCTCDYDGNKCVVHKYSQSLSQRYNNIYLLDCTYKTNRFDMPLLNIVGMACDYTIFSLNFVFLRSETVEYYEWAMKEFATYISYKNDDEIVFSTEIELSLRNAIQRVFINSKCLICTWHINMNILSNCQKYFADDIDKWDSFMKEWNVAMKSHTTELFNEQFKMNYIQDYPIPIRYIENNWLPYKESFVSAFTDIHTF